MTLAFPDPENPAVPLSPTHPNPTCRVRFFVELARVRLGDTRDVSVATEYDIATALSDCWYAGWQHGINTLHDRFVEST